MKSQLRVLALTVGLFCAASGFAQTAAPAAQATAPVSTSAAPAAPAAKASAAHSRKKAAKEAKEANAAAPAMAAPAPAMAAAGGGAGKVWVNSKSKTYHCEGTKFYGKTKTGEYMTEADAKAKGNHADHGKACTK